MHQIVPTEIAEQMMADFARRTGLEESGRPGRRYLWTDAFAVCNFLGLRQLTGDDRYMQRALSLVEQVHEVLGRHREDDTRSGWISGDPEEVGRRHPTRGGLRIGKKINERGRGEPIDSRMEWDRDGQYFHYLTRWMHALDRVGRATGDAVFHRFAAELARTAHRAFTYSLPDGHRRMYWKMSIDLSYPLVPSMGQLDPLDGFVTFSQLQAHAPEEIRNSEALDLSEAIADIADICRNFSWYTDDPLGIGGILVDAYKAARMMAGGEMEASDVPTVLLDIARQGLISYERQGDLAQAARYRLPFREFGLSIGLRAVARLDRLVEQHPGGVLELLDLRPGIEALRPYIALADRIETFWLEDENRQAASWSAHEDINGVMLASSLAPDGYLAI